MLVYSLEFPVTSMVRGQSSYLQRVLLIGEHLVGYKILSATRIELTSAELPGSFEVANAQRLVAGETFPMAGGDPVYHGSFELDDQYCAKIIAGIEDIAATRQKIQDIESDLHRQIRLLDRIIEKAVAIDRRAFPVT